MTVINLPPRSGEGTLIKICGICDAGAALAAAEAGADLLGFHFCTSLRRVTPEEALAMVQGLGLRPAGLGLRPAGLDRRPGLVGVFIDQDPAEVAEIADFVGLDWVQLHGSEDASFPAPRPVIKALKVRDGAIPDASAWPDPVLLDSWSRDQRGGTGRAWDWDLAEGLLRTRRVIVAGGLNPANVGEVVSRHRPYGVDVSSGVESEPRVKDPDLVRAFVEAARAGSPR